MARRRSPEMLLDPSRLGQIAETLEECPALIQEGARAGGARTPFVREDAIPLRFQRARQFPYQSFAPRDRFRSGEVRCRGIPIAVQRLDLAQQAVHQRIMELPREDEEPRIIARETFPVAREQRGDVT